MANNKLISSIDVIEQNRGDLKPFKGIAYHSSRVCPGNLFVCIKGYKTDGHLYLEDALKSGAAAAVVEELRHDVDILQYRVKDSRLALAALANAYYDYPSTKFNLTGVTATNGKTTTTYMINALLEEHGLKTGMVGTVIIKTGDQVRAAELTTPESLDLQGYFQEMVENSVSHAVMEVSSSGLELKRVHGTDYNIAVVNNISREHIDLHGSFEAYFNAKASLVRDAKEGQWAIFNLDCPLTASLVKETKAKVFTYGVKNREADCLVDNLDLSTGRARFTVKVNRKDPAEIFAKLPSSFEVELSVLGLHSVYNAMAATLVGILQDIPVETIKNALYKFRGVERRFELIFEDDYKVIDDHFANSGNIDVTLETLQMMDYENLSFVYAIRGSRGVTVNRENAEAIARWAPKLGLKRVIATTSSSHVGEKDVVTEEELSVFREVMKTSGLEVFIYKELPDAIASGLSNLGKNDVLLLAGCQGMDYGASVCLNQIYQLKPHLPKETVFASLKNRVAGV